MWSRKCWSFRNTCFHLLCRFRWRHVYFPFDKVLPSRCWILGFYSDLADTFLFDCSIFLYWFVGIFLLYSYNNLHVNLCKFIFIYSYIFTFTYIYISYYNPFSGFGCMFRPYGFYEDPESCLHFYVCYTGRTFHFKCPSKLEYSVRHSTCVWPDEHVCKRGKWSKVTSEHLIKDII